VEDGGEGLDDEGGDVQPVNKKLTPLKRAAEQRSKRFLLIAKNPFYVQGAEGEDPRGRNIYATYAFRISFLFSAACVWLV
jgi:hypothetical protein